MHPLHVLAGTPPDETWRLFDNSSCFGKFVKNTVVVSQKMFRGVELHYAPIVKNDNPEKI